VRELENVVERAVILANTATLEIDADVLGGPGPAAADSPRETALEAVERNHIVDILQQTNWVIDGPRGAARLLGLHPNTLRSRLKKLGISRTTHESS
jgi:transcriptional regulator with GAF, ATPase, and Fis domain